MYSRSMLWLSIPPHERGYGVRAGLRTVAEASSTKTPGCLVIVWMHSTSGVHNSFLMRRKSQWQQMQ